MSHQQPSQIGCCEEDHMGSSQNPNCLSSFKNKTQNIFSSCMSLRENFDIRNPWGQFDNQEMGRSGDGDVGAGHVGKYISLANPDKISQMSRHFPLSVVLFLISISFVPTAMFQSGDVFFTIFVLLTFYMVVYCFQLVVFTLIGAYKIRKEVKQPWTSMWQEKVTQNPDVAEGMFHIIIIPNYKELENILSNTVENIGRSHMAKTGHVVVVLAMEAREGPDGKAKADRLIEKHGRDFKDMFATYHPADIENEVAGKSSNTQWAFREVQRWYGNYVSRSDERNDPSKVYLTIADADSILHEDYLTGLSVNGANMSDLERSWSIWQAPVLLLRNWGTVPGVVRNSAYVTFMFEISGLVSARFWEHCCFCTYSMSLALANHPIVDGWDADVIAEDHHMYMKCMFASYWEDIFATRRVNEPSRLKLRPVYLPVTGYIVEDDRGWLYTIYARFQQARRHSQGISELSYCVLQYYSICAEMEGKMPVRAHLRIIGLLMKYLSVHIILNFHSFMLMIMTALGAYWSVGAYLEGNLFQMMGEFADFDQKWQSPEQMAVLALMNFFPVMGAFYIAAWISIVGPTLEGKFCKLDDAMLENKIADKENKQHQQLATNENAIEGKELTSQDERPMTWQEWFRLLRSLTYDCYAVAGISLILYGSVVTVMSVTSLSLYGHKFEYIVAAKPGEGQLEAEKPHNNDYHNESGQKKLSNITTECASPIIIGADCSANDYSSDYKNNIDYSNKNDRSNIFSGEKVNPHGSPQINDIFGTNSSKNLYSQFQYNEGVHHGSAV